VEGLNPQLALLNPLGVPERRDITLKLGVPLISLSAQEQAEVRAEVQTEVQTEVQGSFEEPPSDVGAWRGVGTLPAPLHPDHSKGAPSKGEVWRAVWRLSVNEMPYLTDHCFFRQPQGWPVLRDRFPVVPMTLSVQWVMEAAQAMLNASGLEERVVGVTEVRASKWVEVEPALEVEVEASPSPALSQALTFGELRRVKVTLKGHLSAVVLLSAQPLAPPVSPSPVLPHERPAPISASQVYQDRWMFHGPQYEAIARLDALSPKGIRGLLRATSTPGALLDNVGQLFGLWVMLTEAEDRVVMPVSIKELMIYGPPPVEGELLSCTVWIERLERRDVVAHICVWRGGHLWAMIKGWRDWRFETSGALWSLMRYPERSLYASPLALPPALSERLARGGVPSSALSLTLAEGVSASASSREFLVGRCLNQEEQATYRAAPTRAQQAWLAGRIAAKDAARALRWRAQHAQGAAPSPLFPIEVSTAREESGALCFTAEGAGAPFNTSIAHKGGSALAAACPRALAQLGVDVEPVMERDVAWREVSFSAEERALIEAQLSEALRAFESRTPQPSLALRLRASVWTAAWCVKEARAKASRLGLGAPKQWCIEALSLSVTPQGLIVEAQVRGQAQRADQPPALCVAWSLQLSSAPALAALCVLPSHQFLPPHARGAKGFDSEAEA
jgi:phosphopantetheinyl transferase (holo-ACP synthase)